MAFPARQAVESLADDPKDSSPGASQATTKRAAGPPPASPRPRSASDSSLFSTAGKSATSQSKSGLGAEGANPNVMGTQGLALVQRGIQMLNLSFPENPGLTAVLADITGRLQTIIPQLVAGSSNPGMGLFGNAGPAGMQPPMQPGMPPQGMPAPPMMPPGGAMPPQASGMQGPPMMPPMQQQPPMAQ